MSVPVRGQIKSNREGRFTEKLAAEIGARLIALEKAIRGASPDVFTSPEVPSFGSGSPGGGGTVPSPTPSSGVTDHGALTGLEDDDHPQYGHVLESSHPMPHSHHVHDLLGIENEFYRRNEGVPPTAHSHVVADVSDLRADDAEFILAARIYGG